VKIQFTEITKGMVYFGFTLERNSQCNIFSAFDKY